MRFISVDPASPAPKPKRKSGTLACVAAQNNRLKGHFFQYLPNGDLLCQACSCIFRKGFIFMDRVYTHIAGRRHLIAVKERAHTTVRQAAILECIGKLEFGVDLPPETSLFRFELARGCMIGGNALASIDSLRPVIERNTNLQLTGSSHLGQCKFKCCTPIFEFFFGVFSHF